MAYITPYMTSNDLVASVQRKISMPLSQNLFTAKDILAFANEELFIAQVPSVLEFHEEYFVFTMTVPIIPKIHRYPIPTRAIGMKLRDVKWQDSNKNLFDMSRVNPEDKAFYQQNIGTSETISKYYIEGNDLVLLPALTVTNSITVLNANIVPGDTITINSNDIINKHIFTAVSGLPTADQFQIAGSDIATANNLVAAINLNGLAGTASNGSPATSLVTISFNNILMSQGLITSNPTAFIIPVNIQAIQFDQLPSTYQDPITFVTTPLYTTGVTVDFLQTNPTAFIIPV